jgi:hypothetical protein
MGHLNEREVQTSNSSGLAGFNDLNEVVLIHFSLRQLYVLYLAVFMSQVHA